MEIRYLLFKQYTVIGEVRKCVRNQLQQFMMEDIVRFGDFFVSLSSCYSVLQCWTFWFRGQSTSNLQKCSRSLRKKYLLGFLSNVQVQRLKEKPLRYPWGLAPICYSHLCNSKAKGKKNVYLYSSNTRSSSVTKTTLQLFSPPFQNLTVPVFFSKQRKEKAGERTLNNTSPKPLW